MVIDFMMGVLHMQASIRSSIERLLVVRQAFSLGLCTSMLLALVELGRHSLLLHTLSDTKIKTLQYCG